MVDVYRIGDSNVERSPQSDSGSVFHDYASRFYDRVDTACYAPSCEVMEYDVSNFHDIIMVHFTTLMLTKMDNRPFLDRTVNNFVFYVVEEVEEKHRSNFIHQYLKNVNIAILNINVGKIANDLNYIFKKEDLLLHMMTNLGMKMIYQ